MQGPAGLLWFLYPTVGFMYLNVLVSCIIKVSHWGNIIVQECWFKEKPFWTHKFTVSSQQKAEQNIRHFVVNLNAICWYSYLAQKTSVGPMNYRSPVQRLTGGKKYTLTVSSIWIITLGFFLLFIAYASLQCFCYFSPWGICIVIIKAETFSTRLHFFQYTE